MLADLQHQSATAAAAAPYRYSLFGLTVQSDIELARVEPAPPDAPVDVEIVRCPIDHPALTGAGGMTVSLDLPRQLFAWDTVGRFVVASDHRIEVHPLPGVSDALVALPLLGVVVAALLQRRGLFVLHAGAAEVDGQAVALLGDKGAGKSTAAAALVRAGHNLLADDVVAIDFAHPQGPVILPAVGQLKLWDEAIRAVPLKAEDRGRLHPALAKSTYALSHGVARHSVPLARLYLLTRGDGAGIAPLDAATAVTALFRHSYMGRFGEAGLGATLARHFGHCTALAHRGVTATLTVPAGLAHIGEAVAAIEADLSLPLSRQRRKEHAR